MNHRSSPDSTSMTQLIPQFKTENTVVPTTRNGVSQNIQLQPLGYASDTFGKVEDVQVFNVGESEGQTAELINIVSSEQSILSNGPEVDMIKVLDVNEKPIAVFPNNPEGLKNYEEFMKSSNLAAQQVFQNENVDYGQSIGNSKATTTSNMNTGSTTMPHTNAGISLGNYMSTGLTGTTSITSNTATLAVKQLESVLSSANVLTT